jgi:V/A-type H+-transporting ATPase subunit E
MSETIESFVEKLQKDGIDAGQAEANKLLDNARAEAEKIIAEAKTQAEDITSDARAEAEKTVKQGKDELQLACRDTLLKLHEAVMRSISAMLEQATQTQLKDKDFLANLVREVVVQYAGKDARGDRPVEIKVGDEMLDAVSAWAASETSGPDINITAGMKSAGFEYASSGGTVEVTADSVANVISEMVSPRLREMITKVGEKTEK